MDLLSLIGLATKRRGDYFAQASALAKKCKTWEKLESYMTQESQVLVNALRLKQIRWAEYERSLTDKTLISALAGVYLGASRSKPLEKLEKSWPKVVGDLLPPLHEFLKDTKLALDSGQIRVGDQTEEFAEGIKSWLGLASRVVRFIANPAYSFFNLGDYYIRQEQGYKQMKRVARKDKKTCQDCINFDQQGWQPVGSLPMPGQECRCFDRCRCAIEYR